MPLAPRALDVLGALVERAGEVVTKQELLDRVWPDTFVEEANLSVNVSAVRKTLGRRPGGRPYIETLARRGYRFVPDPADRAHRAPRALAVLPFRVLGEADEDLGLGLSDAVTTRLAGSGGLAVRPSSAAARYARLPDPRQAGRELGADVLVEGTIQRVGARLRVTAQLLDVAAGATIGSGTFDRAADDVFGLQDEVAERVAALMELPAPARAAPPRPEAFRAYLHGRHFWNKLTGPSLARAQEAFTEAAALDPGFAPAHAGLADTQVMRALFGFAKGGEAWPAARAAAERALALDRGLAAAHVSLGWVRLFQDWDFAGAEEALRAARERGPVSAETRQWYALFLGLVGRFGEALAEIEAAREIDPLSLTATTGLGFQLYLTGDAAREAELHRRTLELEPDWAVGHWALALAHERLGRHDDAVAENRKAVALSGESPLLRANLARSLALSGKKKEARTLLASLKAGGVSPYRLATVLEALGDAKGALTALRQAVAERDHWCVWMRVDPMLGPVRRERGFPDLLRAVGFPPEETPD